MNQISSLFFPLFSFSRKFPQDFNKGSQFKVNPRNESNRNKMKITNLNLDCLFIIFEHLNLTDLLNVAEIDDDIHSMAATVFRHRYRHKRIIIQVGDYKYLLNDDDDYDYLAIYDNQMAENVIRKFGSVISRMDMLYFPYNKEVYSRFSRLVAVYCSDSLVDFDFNENFHLNHLSRPLKNVERVVYIPTIPNGRMEYPPHGKMNTMFPALRRLTMDRPYLDDNFLNCTIPNLVHLELLETPDHFERSPIKDLFASNPHIQSFQTRRATQQFLDILMENLPNLTHLTLTECYMENLTNHFDRVTTLKIVQSKRFESHLTFSNLQELSIEYEKMNLAGLGDFLYRNPTVIRFTLGIREGSNELFEQIASHMGNIVEITLLHLDMIVKKRSVSIISADTISNFIKNHDKLQRFHLDWCTESDKKIFSDRLSDYWHIITYKQCHSFQRIHV